jgi:hypothetical protein
MTEPKPITRRRFVAGTIATGAAAAVPAAAEAAKRRKKHPVHKKHKTAASETQRADVVVVGAGFAGLTWARTETSDYWNGYMDRAVRSGERAAAEALAQL